jgi:hypothetical protein
MLPAATSDELGEATTLTLELSRVLGQFGLACPSLLQQGSREDEPFDVKEDAVDLILIKRAHGAISPGVSKK